MEIRGQEHRERLSALARGRRPLPRKRADRLILLHAVAQRFADASEWSERALTERIQDWLLGPAAFLDSDPVTLRRALIDEGFLTRDAAGSRYVASSRYERSVRFEDPPADPDQWLTGRPDAGWSSGAPAVE